jgi:hypothetical protein
MAAIGGIGSGGSGGISAAATFSSLSGGNRGRIAELERQKQQLEKQYGDTACCTTTPDALKHRQEAQLNQQIGAVSAQITQAQQTQSDGSASPAASDVSIASVLGQFIDIKV